MTYSPTPEDAIKKPEKPADAPAQKPPKATTKEPTEGGPEDEADASEELPTPAKPKKPGKR